MHYAGVSCGSCSSTLTHTCRIVVVVWSTALNGMIRTLCHAIYVGVVHIAPISCNIMEVRQLGAAARQARMGDGHMGYLPISITWQGITQDIIQDRMLYTISPIGLNGLLTYGHMAMCSVPHNLLCSPCRLAHSSAGRVARQVFVRDDSLWEHMTLPNRIWHVPARPVL